MADNSKSEYVCERHDVKELPTGYDKCPYCMEEESIASQQRHQQTRDTSIEPY